MLTSSVDYLILLQALKTVYILNEMEQLCNFGI